MIDTLKQYICKNTRTDLDDAAAHEGAVAHGQLPLAVEQHAHGLPPCQRKRLPRQRRRVPILPACMRHLIALKSPSRYSALCAVALPPLLSETVQRCNALVPKESHGELQQ